MRKLSIAFAILLFATTSYGQLTNFAFKNVYLGDIAISALKNPSDIPTSDLTALATSAIFGTVPLKFDLAFQTNEEFQGTFSKMDLLIKSEDSEFFYEMDDEKQINATPGENVMQIEMDALEVADGMDAAVDLAWEIATLGEHESTTQYMFNYEIKDNSGETLYTTYDESGEGKQLAGENAEAEENVAATAASQEKETVEGDETTETKDFALNKMKIHGFENVYLGDIEISKLEDPSKISNQTLTDLAATAIFGTVPLKFDFAFSMGGAEGSFKELAMQIKKDDLAFEYEMDEDTPLKGTAEKQYMTLEVDALEALDGIDSAVEMAFALSTFGMVDNGTEVNVDYVMVDEQGNVIARSAPEK